MQPLQNNIVVGCGIGFLFGLIPLFRGVAHHQHALGIAGFFASIALGGVFGFILAVPVAVVFAVVIARAGDNVTAEAQRAKSQFSKDSAPELWNPTESVWWSALFTPAFGAFLHSRNSMTLGRPEEAKANKQWFYIFLAYMGIDLISIGLPGITPYATWALTVPLMACWYISAARPQIQHISSTYGEAYVRRSMLLPILVGATFLFAYAFGALTIRSQ